MSGFQLDCKYLVPMRNKPSQQTIPNYSDQVQPGSKAETDVSWTPCQLTELTVITSYLIGTMKLIIVSPSFTIFTS